MIPSESIVSKWKYGYARARGQARLVASSLGKCEWVWRGKGDEEEGRDVERGESEKAF